MGGKDSLIGRLLGNTQEFNAEQIEQTIRLLVEHGLKRGASDIHIEPHEQFVVVRYRIDGDLRGVHKLPRLALEPLLGQIKEAANLRPTVNNVPQEGEYTLRVDDQDVSVRVATLPVLGGEKMVLHLILHSDPVQSLETLGFWGTGLRSLQTTLAQPHGLVIVATPKRGGKTTTLYSLLHLVHAPHLNSSTVEERIEHHLQGISQTQIRAHAGFGFAEGVQAVIRQDANVILLSNIPDQSSAELAVHAATTGHLVLAGLHANSSATALLQLRTTGVRPFLLATATRLVISQRLVRRLCEHCRERYELTAAERTHIQKAFALHGVADNQALHELEQLAAKELGGGEMLNSSPKHITHLWRAHAEGCIHCEHSGYLGRAGIVEVLPMNESLRSLLLGPTSVSNLERTAAEANVVPLRLDGLVKALRGISTTEEILRVLPRAA